MFEIKTEKVKVQNGNLTIDAYLAQPTSEGNLPGVVVIQEIFGVNEHIRDVTEKIAKQGYVAIAPAIYQRQAPGFETGYTPEDIEIGRVYKNKTSSAELLSDIQATIDYLYELPNLKKTGVGCIGFCFGGHVAYLVSSLKDIKASASFYGAGIANWNPGGGNPTISMTKDIKGTIYTFFGMEDASIPVAEVNQIESELQKYNISHQVFRYENAEHGFFCDRRSSYNKEAAEDAWLKVLELFNQTLKE